MALIVPFPGARQVGFARRQAAYAATLTAEKARSHIDREIRRRADCLVRKGAPEDLVAIEMRALRSAIEAETWRLVLAPRRPLPPGGRAA